MTELVRVKVFDVVAISKFLKIPCRALRVHGISRAVLRKDVAEK